MRLTPLLLVSLYLSSIACPVLAQDSAKWDLKRCVAYAVNNNISIRQADIDARFSRLTFQQARSAQYGNASFNTGIGANFGRSINATTNVYDNFQGLSQTYSLQAGITLFNWFALRRAVEATHLSYDAQSVNIDKVKNDVTLNVAAAYLQALLSREQVNVGNTKLALTRQQLVNTRRLVDAGSVPELNAAELEAQFATDTAALIGAQETRDINVLQLKAILNLDAAVPFDLDTPPVESIPVQPIAELQPGAVFEVAVRAFPQQKMNDLRIRSAEKNVDYSRALLYPSIQAYGGVGSRFANDFRGNYIAFNPDAPIGYYNSTGGTKVPVFAPSPYLGFYGRPVTDVFNGYGSQLNNNFGQQVGLQINVPIFNGNITRTNYQKAKLNVESAKLTRESDLMTLKQNIYQAYYNAVASMEKFQANQKAVSTAQRSFDLAGKRYNIGMLNTIDYLTNQNNLFTARINQLSAQYDYVFRVKVLEYYKGLGIKL